MAKCHKCSHLSTTDVTFEFPGMQCYLESNEGKTFLKTLSTRDNCYFEFSSKDKTQKTTFDKKCLLFQTIVCYGFNVHLVKGFIGDIHCQLKVQFMPSNKEKCYAQDSGNGLYLIYLPPWRIKGDQQISHFQTLRTSLSASINYVIHVAQQDQSQTLVFSAENISDAEYPFPLDAIAHALVESLCEAYSYTQNVNLQECSSFTPDIYVCEPTREAVFKAFTFVFNRYAPIICTGTDQQMHSKGFHECKTKIPKNGRVAESNHRSFIKSEKQHHSNKNQPNKKGNEIMTKVTKFVNKLTTSKAQNPEVQHKPKSAKSSLALRISKTTIKISGQSIENNGKTTADLKKHLEDLMTQNTSKHTLNEQQTIDFEKMMRNAEEMPVQFFLDKGACFSKERNLSRGRSQRDRIAHYSDRFKESLLTVCGLQKETVTEFINMVLGESPFYFNSSSQVESASVTECSDEDDRKSQQKTSINASLSAHKSECEEYFCWMIETQPNKGENIDFVPYANSEQLEEHYKKMEKITTKDTSVVNFKTMKICVDGDEKWLICSPRTDHATYYPDPPRAWETSTNNPYKLKLVSNADKEFKNIEDLLTDNIVQWEYWEIKEIKRIENLQLWQSYEWKKHMTKSSDSIMWHRVSATCQSFVCKYGLHKNFSAMPLKAKTYGDSVVLVRSPNDCLTQSDLNDGEEVHLVLAQVLHEKKGEKQNCMSSSPVNVFDGEHTICSDAEAYPCHIVTIKVKPRTSSE
ncbi:unnamed protein product [Lymnaea stagnalis]|uniref:PARP catalytic domain-containing protein n=1 Tax=Lymnaea stagnalis TaxID=6523 RepID=A0AAV2IK37_LYMST